MARTPDQAHRRAAGGLRLEREEVAKRGVGEPRAAVGAGDQHALRHARQHFTEVIALGFGDSNLFGHSLGQAIDRRREPRRLGLCRQRQAMIEIAPGETVRPVGGAGERGEQAVAQPDDDQGRARQSGKAGEQQALPEAWANAEAVVAVLRGDEHVRVHDETRFVRHGRSMPRRRAYS